MSFTKPTIYNLTLSALLLSREVSDVDTDDTNEVRILNTHYDIAFNSTLRDLDLDSTSSSIKLELIETLTNEPWSYSYKYPADCALFRRVKSSQITDNRQTHISKRVGLRNGVKVILTNEINAIIEYIPKSVPLSTLTDMTAMAIAYKLAFLSAPLIVGKGSKSLRESLQQAYVIAKTEAQESDMIENFVYEQDDQRSEFVAERLS